VFGVDYKEKGHSFEWPFSYKFVFD